MSAKMEAPPHGPGENSSCLSICTVNEMFSILVSIGSFGCGGKIAISNCLSLCSKFDALIQAQARELSHLRQQRREGRGVCTILVQHLSDTTKAFEELLRANDIDYYMGQSFREQLAQGSALAQRVSAKISGRESLGLMWLSLMFSDAWIPHVREHVIKLTTSRFISTQEIRPKIQMRRRSCSPSSQFMCVCVAI